MFDLDNLQLYKQCDPQNMLGHIKNIPATCKQARQMASTFKLPKDYSNINKIVVLAMGGSAIGGDLAAGLVEGEVNIPVFVNRSYNLPAGVDNNTLIIAASYSGMTNETLSAFNQALCGNSKKLIITTGGKLGDLARENGIPVFNFDYESQPRAAFPFILLPVLSFIQQLGLINDISADIEEMVATLEKLNEEINETVPVTDNKAKKMAQTLYGNLAVVYGGGITAAVSRRWKTQLNENSKAWASYDVFSELDHNAIVGYQFPQGLSSKMMVIMLRSKYLQAPILSHYRLTARILNQADIKHFILDGSGNGKLAQMMSLVMLGDYISYYLALLNGVDPTPIEAIDCLKEAAKKEQL